MPACLYLYLLFWVYGTNAYDCTACCPTCLIFVGIGMMTPCTTLIDLGCDTSVVGSGWHVMHKGSGAHVQNPPWGYRGT
jgi:hypothetical protein